MVVNKIKKIQHETTKVQSIANTQEGVRTTIPAILRRTANIKKGDILNWEIYLEENKVFAKITKKDHDEKKE